MDIKSDSKCFYAFLTIHQSYKKIKKFIKNYKSKYPDHKFFLIEEQISSKCFDKSKPIISDKGHHLHFIIEYKLLKLNTLRAYLKKIIIKPAGLKGNKGYSLKLHDDRPLEKTFQYLHKSFLKNDIKTFDFKTIKINDFKKKFKINSQKLHELYWKTKYDYQQKLEEEKKEKARIKELSTNEKILEYVIKKLLKDNLIKYNVGELTLHQQIKYQNNLITDNYNTIQKIHEIYKQIVNYYIENKLTYLTFNSLEPKVNFILGQLYPDTLIKLIDKQVRNKYHRIFIDEY